MKKQESVGKIVKTFQKERAFNGVVALILGAGTSSRMGQTKQLLKYKESYLLEYVIRRILSFNFSRVFTVVGYEAEKIQHLIQIDDSRFQWVVNLDYRKGQSSSLLKGIRSIGKSQSSVMVFLGDQPLISKNTISLILHKGIDQYALTPNQPFVIQPSYQGTPGHPVFFGNLHMIDFTQLKGDRGAKKIIRNMDVWNLIPVQDQGILLDIDTPEAYKRVIHFHES
ncbi:nucleotidyltransferase family protein [Bacillus alveayuensis]|uniref:nucleotidyltransferase family protein n=1 Tax=Aeribacillus alveayuensis TaxID=279215 RepID=UPI0005D0F9AE|nr:nucleotidyltransferase family protein [Bacillus alveayuensis]